MFGLDMCNGFFQIEGFDHLFTQHKVLCSSIREIYIYISFLNENTLQTLIFILDGLKYFQLILNNVG